MLFFCAGKFYLGYLNININIQSYQFFLVKHSKFDILFQNLGLMIIFLNRLNVILLLVMNVFDLIAIHLNIIFNN